MSLAFYLAWCLLAFVMMFSFEIEHGWIVLFIITYIVFCIWVATEVGRALRRM